MDNKVLEKKLGNAVKNDQKGISEGNRKKCNKIFRENTKILKEIINKNGWPSKGKTAHHAWLIAQHSDHDPAFQLTCLGLLIPNIPKNKEQFLNSIYLIDRLLINTGNRQIYGTQINAQNMPLRMFNPEQVNHRRSQVGLGKIEEYIETVRNLRG